MKDPYVKLYKSIEACWFDLCRRCEQEGYYFEVEKGSFEKEGIQRAQLPAVAFAILPGGPIEDIAGCRVKSNGFEKIRWKKHCKDWELYK